MSGRTINSTPEKLAYTLRQPIGVVSQIIPWNFVKDASFPHGVVNFLNSYGAEARSTLVRHPLVDKVAFTGSIATAKTIMTMAAKTLKKITLETGGKSPLVVFSDADLEQAVKWSHSGIMSNQDQICTATSRILVIKSIYDEFLAKFKTAVGTISKIGDQRDENTDQGPQGSKAQYGRVLSYIIQCGFIGRKCLGHLSSSLISRTRKRPSLELMIPPTVLEHQYSQKLPPMGFA